MAGIYIHIPFCKQACYYCDFHFSTNQTLKAEMVNAICQELVIQKNYVEGKPIETIYFGGGTPSLLTQQQTEQILATVYDHYQVSSQPEVTLEANPDDLSEKKLNELKALGVNRLSIGIQSFDDEVLRFLNRAHDSGEAFKCIENARTVGIDNLSIDLIYAIPDRNSELWTKDLQAATNLEPSHISSYCLTIEPDTIFGRKREKGKFKDVSDDKAADQFEILINHLSEKGYEQYEVSNFCLPGRESKHNSSYWKQEAYLGVGPSAHSYNRVNRQFNVSHNKKYLDALAVNNIPFTLDALSQKDKINDYLLTTLRTKWGADLQRLKMEFGYDLLTDQADYINNLLEQQNAQVMNNHLVLSKKGLLLADLISSDLFLL
ncbi:radical SAM family heme chaperone HemW [Fulvivirga sp. RKSG066]|uniref:radical SAM family heme chaperone HemW n=1 Tax=Fulvivirga aurantia TaxID=2529383 RepID=UPI0012BBDA65|nr:radical SAM family heme chaperone HemW [Fulvivirga aurantia]MTI21252.1 radical SAM family heme chaperone HemW [Fulvivirga aurantia]